MKKFHARSLGVDLGCQLLTVNGKQVWRVGCNPQCSLLGALEHVSYFSIYPMNDDGLVGALEHVYPYLMGF